MSEREPGWYWVRARRNAKWTMAYWNARFFYAAKITRFFYAAKIIGGRPFVTIIWAPKAENIGPRIEPPKEET